jgi:16S rRNA (cytosine1402-N4)-methyltransferase
MVDDVLQALNPRPGGVVVDATVGTGGHAVAILPRLLPNGQLIGVDRDREALAISRGRLAEFAPQVSMLYGNFRELPAILGRLGIGRIDGLLVDLGVSSLQLDRPARGFSFSAEGPLDMRMDPEQPTTAATLVNSLPADELAHILETLGEERFAKRIAHRVVEARRRGEVATTGQLARLVTEAMPAGARHGRLHAATRTFLALRLAVNDELGALETLLACLPELLNPGGHVVALSFHSLEDRLLKRAFAAGDRAGRFRLLTKKPVRPEPAEVANNPRARSAKLRAVEQL